MDRAAKVIFSKLRVDGLCDWVVSSNVAPLMHIMEQHIRAKFSQHRNHPMAVLYGIPLFSLSIDSSLLQSGHYTVAQIMFLTQLQTGEYDNTKDR